MPIPVSANNFAKDVPVKSAHTFADDAPAKSTNAFKEDVPQVGGYAWEGENMTGGIGIGDMMSGVAPDTTESGGGFSHFQNRAKPPDIAH